MQKSQVTLVVHLKAKKGMGAKLEEAALSLIPLTRAEPGCIEYNFHANAQESDSYLFYENWVDQNALDKHLAMPYLVKFKTLLAEILCEPAQFTFWNMA
jgi:quinol monooxygenase YgiN